MGITNKEMALKLKCSIKTIEYYKKEIRDKNIVKDSIRTKETDGFELGRITDTELNLMII